MLRIVSLHVFALDGKIKNKTIDLLKTKNSEKDTQRTLHRFGSSDTMALVRGYYLQFTFQND